MPTRREAITQLLGAATAVQVIECKESDKIPVVIVRTKHMGKEPYEAFKHYWHKAVKGTVLENHALLLMGGIDDVQVHP